MAYNIFSGLETHPIPLEFNNKLTTAEWLSYLEGIINEVANSNEEFQGEIKENINAKVADAIKQIKDYLNSTDFTDKNAAEIQRYMNEHISDMIGDALKLIQFTLSDDGYFVAAIPESWSFIGFDTNVDSTSENYGKLIIQY